LFILLGALGGGVGAAFVGANRAITLWRFKHVPVARPWRRVAEVLAVVALNSAAKFWLSRVAGTCLRVPKAGTGADGGDALTYFVGQRSFCAEGEYNDLASLFLVPSEDAIRQLFHFTTAATAAAPSGGGNNDGSGGASLTVASVAVFFVAYTALAVLAYGIAVPAGLFIPSLLSGAALGRLAGEALNAALLRVGALTGGAQVSVGVYALLGAAAVLGGNTRMVISLAVLVIECTGNYQFALPLMVVLFAARFTGGLFGEGIYDLHINLRKVPILRDAVPHRFAYALKARDVMARAPSVAVLREVEEAGRVLEALERGGGGAQKAFPVVFEAERGEEEEEEEEEEMRAGADIEREEEARVRRRRGNFAGLVGRRELAFLLSLRALRDDRPSDSARGTAAAAALPRGDVGGLLKSPGGADGLADMPLGVLVGGHLSLQRSPGFADDRQSPPRDLRGLGGLAGFGFGSSLHRSTSYESLSGAVDSEEPRGERDARQTSSSASLSSALPATAAAPPPLEWRVLHDGTPEPTPAQLRAALTAAGDLRRWVDLRPYLNAAPFTVREHAPLDRAFRLFRQQGLRHLVVLNGAGDAAGLITRNELIDDALEARLRDARAAARASRARSVGAARSSPGLRERR
jgi:hypothetical protein